MDPRRRRARLLIELLRVSTTLFGRAVVDLLVFSLTLLSIPLVVAWIGIPMLIRCTDQTRTRADRERSRIGQLLEITRASVYLPRPETGGAVTRLRALVADPACRTDLRWLLFQATGGVLLTAMSMVECAVHLGLWWLPGPSALTVYSRISWSLLWPTGTADWRNDVTELSRRSGADTDHHAGELRRIERDLHDGAQARLVALAMHLGVAEQLLDNQPEAARQMLAQARETSSDILSELRDLVRGIYPPVLSDRGLGDAIRAASLTSAIPVELTVDLPDERLTATVEACAYFSLMETITNAAKHSGAPKVAVDIRMAGSTLIMSVVDNGAGGAVGRSGGGLAGLRDRLSASGGTLRISSPSGGPTAIVMKIPVSPAAAAATSG